MVSVFLMVPPDEEQSGPRCHRQDNTHQQTRP